MSYSDLIHTAASMRNELLKQVARRSGDKLEGKRRGLSHVIEKMHYKVSTIEKVPKLA